MSQKYLPGLNPLKQFMEGEGSFLMPEIPAVLRVLQAIRAPEYMDYDYLLSVSGMSVRLAWQQGWAEYQGIPNQGVFYDEDEKGVFGTVFERTGVKYSKRLVADVGIETAEAEIKNSIDNNKPVLVIGPCVCSCILGYTDDVLHGVAVFPPDNAMTDENGYYIFTSWKNELEEYYLIDGFEPKKMDKQLLQDTLRTAIHYSRTTHDDKLGDTRLGTAAFDAISELLVWDEGFEMLKPGESYEGEISFPYRRPDGFYRMDGARTLEQRFWAGYCDFLSMLYGYENMSKFLTKYSDVESKWSSQLLSAAKDYHVACDYSGALWNYVTPDAAGVARFKEQRIRYTFAAHMLRAKIYTIRAAETLESILS